MSRSYSKKRFQEAKRFGWYRDEPTEEDRIVACKKWAARSRVGQGGCAPNWFVRSRFTCPFRQAERRLCHSLKLAREEGWDEDDFVLFPKFVKGAWYLWY